MQRFEKHCSGRGNSFSRPCQRGWVEAQGFGTQQDDYSVILSGVIQVSLSSWRTEVEAGVGEHSLVSVSITRIAVKLLKEGLAAFGTQG